MKIKNEKGSKFFRAFLSCFIEFWIVQAFLDIDRSEFSSEILWWNVLINVLAKFRNVWNQSKIESTFFWTLLVREQNWDNQSGQTLSSTFLKAMITSLNGSIRYIFKSFTVEYLKFLDLWYTDVSSVHEFDQQIL